MPDRHWPNPVRHSVDLSAALKPVHGDRQGHRAVMVKFHHGRHHKPLLVWREMMSPDRQSPRSNPRPVTRAEDVDEYLRSPMALGKHLLGPPERLSYRRHGSFWIGTPIRLRRDQSRASRDRHPDPVVRSRSRAKLSINAAKAARSSPRRVNRSRWARSIWPSDIQFVCEPYRYGTDPAGAPAGAVGRAAAAGVPGRAAAPVPRHDGPRRAGRGPVEHRHRDDGTVLTVDSHAFRPTALTAPVFKAPQLPRGPLFVDERFAAAAAGLAGMDFVEAWST